MEKKKNFI